MTLEEKQIAKDFVIDERVAEAIKKHLKDGKLPCAQAFLIAKELNIPPLTVGQTADVLEIHLTRCQIGLFGYPKGKGWVSTNVADLPVPEGLEDAILGALDEYGNFACERVWKIADQFGLPRMQVAYRADKMGVRIAPCQLGAF